MDVVTSVFGSICASVCVLYCECVYCICNVCVCVSDLGAAVAMMGGSGPVQGVVRFLQLSEERCLIDGTIDGLEPGTHGLHVHTLGDLTQDCQR